MQCHYIYILYSEKEEQTQAKCWLKTYWNMCTPLGAAIIFTWLLINHVPTAQSLVKLLWLLQTLFLLKLQVMLVVTCYSCLCSFTQKYFNILFSHYLIFHFIIFYLIYLYFIILFFQYLCFHIKSYFIGKIFV